MSTQEMLKIRLELLQTIRAHNKREAKEYPEYIEYNQMPIDHLYWKERGVTTAQEFTEYQCLVECWSDMMKDMNGFRPRVDILTLERLQADWISIRNASEEWSREQDEEDEATYIADCMPNNGIPISALNNLVNG